MTRFDRIAFAAVVCIVCSSSALPADVRITENTSAKAGDRSVQGVRSIYIRGSRMRIELTQNNRTTATVFDLPAGAIVDLEPEKKRAEIREIGARNAQLEKSYPRARSSVVLTATGATKVIADLPCEESAYVVKVPMTKDGETVLTLTGSAWTAPSAPGAVDYHAFVQAAVARELVMGYASDNAILLAVTRGQTELYRAVGALPGIPYMVDFVIGVEGKGVVAGMIRKATSGSRTSTVTSVAAAPLSDATFEIPYGWKREKK